MGLYTVECPECGQIHMWFSGENDQRCQDCKNKENKEPYQFVGIDDGTGDVTGVWFNFNTKGMFRVGKWIDPKTLEEKDAIVFVPDESIILAALNIECNGEFNSN